MAETRNFGTYNKKDIKSISGQADRRATPEQPNRRTSSTKNLKDKLQKSTESIKQTKLADLEREARDARRSREERENERRKRNDELRMRNNDRRNRVEERKRLMIEAERDKQEAILRKNQEIEARIEAKKNKEKEEKRRRKSEKLISMPVAFGSSTPRMLCPNDTNVSFSMSFLAKERDNGKKQASIIAGGRNGKFNESCKTTGRSERSNSFNSQTTNDKRNEPVRKIQTPRNGIATSKTIGVSSFKVLTRLTRNSDGDTTPTDQSRSSSSMSHQSTSTYSLDSCNVKLRPRTIVPRRPIVDNNISKPVKVNHQSRDAKLTPIKPLLPKVHGTPKIVSMSTLSEKKKRLTIDTSEIKKQEEEQRLMENTMRMANEMLEMEKKRLKIAIEEMKRWEEEEQRKREEKDRKKWEKKEAEKKAMEEAERQRIEFFERLKRSEEERLARRKRVEIIMLRTRG